MIPASTAVADALEIEDEAPTPEPAPPLGFTLTELRMLWALTEEPPRLSGAEVDLLARVRTKLWTVAGGFDGAGPSA